MQGARPLKPFLFFLRSQISRSCFVHDGSQAGPYNSGVQLLCYEDYFGAGKQCRTAGGWQGEWADDDAWDATLVRNIDFCALLLMGPPRPAAPRPLLLLQLMRDRLVVFFLKVHILLCLCKRLCDKH